MIPVQQTDNSIHSRFAQEHPCGLQSFFLYIYSNNKPFPSDKGSKKQRVVTISCRGIKNHIPLFAA